MWLSSDATKEGKKRKVALVTVTQEKSCSRYCNESCKKKATCDCRLLWKVSTRQEKLAAVNYCEKGGVRKKTTLVECCDERAREERGTVNCSGKRP